MSYPFRENLEVYTALEGAKIRCTKCFHILCEADQDWRQACRRRLLSPMRIGPLMTELVGRFSLEELYCPSCGSLLDSDLVEDEAGRKEIGTERPSAKGPKKPQPVPLSLEIKGTAVVVLDLTSRSSEMFPGEAYSRLLSNASDFLEKARPAGVPVIFTASAKNKGTPLGEVASSLRRRPTEAVIHPDNYDKFFGGELRQLLDERQVKNLILIGAATNVAVLYTATAAARVYRYNVVIPIDGVLAQSDYEQEYALHQLASLPGAVRERIRFTVLSLIQFR